LFVWASGALAEIAPRLALADDARAWPPVVAATGSCPDGSAVQTLLAGLLPPAPPATPAAAASVSDLGDSYVVAMGDRVKTYADVTRDCAERARVAAAFISLAIVPNAPPLPAPEDMTPPPSKPAQPSLSKPDAPTSPPRLWGRIDARGTYVDAPASGVLAPGIALGVAAGRGRIGAHASCEWIAGASMSIPGEAGAIVIERFPCALGPLLKILPATAPLEVNASAGAVVGALRTMGTGFSSSYDSVRLEVGARVSIDATLHFGQRPGDLAPVIGLDATYDPIAYDLIVLPSGVVGHTPNFWAGASAGVSWSIP
jgi:hypothetical protein